MERFVLILVTLCLACYLGQQPTKAEDTESLVERLLTELLVDELEDELRKRRTETLELLLGKRSAWDAYLDNLQAQSKDASGVPHLDKACIIGLDGGSKWTSDGAPLALQITAAEAVAVARVFKRQDFSPFMSGGIYLEGVKYQFLREEDSKLVLGKKKDHGAVTLQASKTAVIIAHTPEGKQQGNTNKAVAVIADYLEGMNM